MHDEKPITVWDLHQDNKLISLGNKEMRITKVKFLTNKYIFSTGEDKIIRTWDLNTGKIIRAFKGREGYPASLKEFSNKKNLFQGTAQ